MAAIKLIAYSYQFARTPLTVFDLTVLRRLPADSGARKIVDRVFGTIDLAAGRVLADETLTRQGAERLAGPAARPTATPGTPSAAPTAARTPAATRPAATKPATTRPAATKPAAAKATEPAAKATTKPAAKKPAAKPTPGQRARAAAAKSQQHDDARANQSVQKIAQRLAETEAIVEARDAQDAQLTD